MLAVGIRQTLLLSYAYDNCSQIMIDEDRLEKLWSYYRPIGSSEYEMANLRRIEYPSIKIFDYGDEERSITLIATIAVDPNTGEAISGHELDPEAQSMHDIEIKLRDWVAHTPPEKQLIIYEGDDRQFDDRASAIMNAQDSGLVQFLAQLHDIASCSGEAPYPDVAEHMLRQGVSDIELASHYITRGVQYAVIDTEWDLIGYIYHQCALAGMTGFDVISENEKTLIMVNGNFAEVQQQMKLQVAPVAEYVNVLCRLALAGHDFFTITDTLLSLSPTINNPDNFEQCIERLAWKGSARINEIARINMEVRDQALVAILLSMYESGICPFVVYGGSHIICIEKVIAAYVDNSPF
jgi:hypothetical protein